MTVVAKSFELFQPVEQIASVQIAEVAEAVEVVADVNETSREWRPIEVPKPTYAMAPKAIISKRVIDLTVPGQWSAEQELLNSMNIPSRDGLFDQELAEQAVRDRASNN